MISSSEQPIQITGKALTELKTILEKDIGKVALSKLSEAEINHIGYLMLRLTAIQLKIKIREKRRANAVDNTEALS